MTWQTTHESINHDNEILLGTLYLFEYHGHMFVVLHFHLRPQCHLCSNENGWPQTQTPQSSNESNVP